MLVMNNHRGPPSILLRTQRRAETLTESRVAQRLCDGNAATCSTSECTHKDGSTLGYQWHQRLPCTSHHRPDIVYVILSFSHSLPASSMSSMNASYDLCTALLTARVSVATLVVSKFFLHASHSPCSDRDMVHSPPSRAGMCLS